MLLRRQATIIVPSGRVRVSALVAGSASVPPGGCRHTSFLSRNKNPFSLQKGTFHPLCHKEADSILLRTDRLNVTPLNDPIGAVVIGADTSNVDSVLSAGRAMKRQGQVLHVDLDRVHTLALASRDSVVVRSGFASATV